MSLSQSSALERKLSIEETYSLAATARRKSATNIARNDLRMKVGHAIMIEALEQVIRSSPPPSPRQSVSQPAQSSSVSYSSLGASRPTSLARPAVDEYGFAYDDEEEDEDSLSLCRTQSRRD